MIEFRGVVVRWLPVLAWCVLGALSARADHPFLAEVDSGNWHAPEGTGEVVFLGDASKAEPRVVLKRGPIAAGAVIIQIQSDCTAVVMSAGQAKMALPFEPDSTARLTLNGSENHPTLAWNDRELTAERGRWIALFIRVDSPTLTLTFTKATYVNLHFNPRADTPEAAFNPQVRTVVVKRAPDSPRSDGTTVIEHDRQRTAIPAGSDVILGPQWEWKFTGGISLDFSNAYYYRGIGQENQGLIIQPKVHTTLRVYEGESTAWFNEFNFHINLLSSHHFGGPTGKGAITGNNRKWYELNLEGGMSVRMFDRWRVSVLFGNRNGTNRQLGDVHDVAFRVDFDDRDPNYDWRLNPYALVSFEIGNEADAGNQNSSLGTSSGGYAELGVNAQFDLYLFGASRPITVFIPAAVGLSMFDYFEDGAGGNDTFGYFRVGGAVRVPVVSFPDASGRRFQWFATGGVDVLLFGDSLRNLNAMNGTSNESVAVVGRLGFGVDY